MDASFLLLPDAQYDSRSRPSHSTARLAASDEVVSRGMHVRRFAARQRIFSVGDAATSIFEVAQGAVFISRYLKDGRRQIVDIVQPGRLFGFADARHDCCAEACVNSVVCSLDRDSAAASPTIARRMQSGMLEELLKLRSAAILLGRKEAIERVASFLCALAGPDALSGTKLRIPFTRGEIADYLGLTEETVSRSISRLKKLALIEITVATDIVLRDPMAIRNLADGGAAA